MQETVNHEMKHFDCGLMESSLSVGERIDKIDRDNSYVKLDPLSTINQEYETRQWIYRPQGNGKIETVYLNWCRFAVLA